MKRLWIICPLVFLFLGACSWVLITTSELLEHVIEHYVVEWSILYNLSNIHTRQKNISRNTYLFYHFITLLTLYLQRPNARTVARVHSTPPHSWLCHILWVDKHVAKATSHGRSVKLWTFLQGYISCENIISNKIVLWVSIFRSQSV